MSERRVFAYDPTGGGFSPMTEEVVAPTEEQNETVEVDVQNEQPDIQDQTTNDVTDTVDEQESSEEAQTEEEQEPEVQDDSEGSTEDQHSQSQESDEESEDEGQSEAENHEVTDEDDDETEEEIYDDFYTAAAAQMIESGDLPEDFSIETLSDVDNPGDVIYNTYRESLRKDVHTELLQEFQSELQNRGWTERTLEYAAMLENGVQPTEIRAINDYSNYANIDTSKLSDDDKFEYVRSMYSDRGWKDKEIKRTMESIEIDGDIDSSVNEALTYFKSRRDEKALEQQQIAEQNRAQKAALARYQQQVLNHIFTKKDLGGEKFTDDELDAFENAIYDKTVPVQHNGQVYQVSEFDQFQSSLENDLALKLWAFKKWKFRDQEVERIKAQALAEAEDNQMIRWGKRKKKVSKKTTSQPPQQQEKQTETKTVVKPAKNKVTNDSGSTYIWDGGEIKAVPRK